MTNPFGGDEFLTIFDVAERTGEELSTIETWLEQGLKFNRLAGHRSVMQSDLTQWVKTRRNADVLPTTEADESPKTGINPMTARMSVQEYASKCGISPECVEEWVDDGLPHTERDGKRYITRRDVLAFLDFRKTHTPDTTNQTRSESTGTESVIVAESGIPLSEIFN